MAVRWRNFQRHHQRAFLAEIRRRDATHCTRGRTRSCARRLSSDVLAQVDVVRDL